MKIDELSLEEKIGQLLMVGLDNKRDDEIEKLIKINKIGGVVLYKKSYNTYSEMIKYVNNIKTKNRKNSIPLFISIDQEGGRVNRMPSEIINLKSATKVVKAQDVELAKETGTIIGEMLYKSGISMNYAPVLDIKRFEEKHAIGDRCYGESKEDVIKYGLEVMKKEQEQKIISTIKHFPGHGLTKKDSHFRIPKIDKKIELLEKEDMIPFEEAMNNGADCIMIGHLIIKDVDKKYPASLSKKVINNYLIEKYNYEGLIITDDLKMLAIQLHYNLKKAVLKAIEAGNDIVMIGVSYKKIEKIIKYITKKVQKGKLSERLIDNKVEKILKMKEKYEVNDGVVRGFDIENINERITSINNKIEGKIEGKI